MDVLKVETADYPGNDGQTVSITMLNKNGEELCIRVQTKDGLYREDLGCLVYTLTGSLEEEFFNEFDDYIEGIVKVAETFMALKISGEGKVRTGAFTKLSIWIKNLVLNTKNKG